MKPSNVLLALACIFSMAATPTLASPEPENPVTQGVFLENTTVDAQTLTIQAPAADIEFAASDMSTGATTPVPVLQAGWGSSFANVFVQQECCGGSGWTFTDVTRNLFYLALIALVSWFVLRSLFKSSRKTYSTAH